MPNPQARNLDAADRRFVRQHAEDRSRTTVAYAKWIHSADEAPDHGGQTLATRNHDVIRRWAQARQATPATVENGSGRPRVLRFDFAPDEDQGGSLKPISWDDWLGVFDDRELVFLCQETRADGHQSNFFQLDSPRRNDG